MTLHGSDEELQMACGRGEALGDGGTDDGLILAFVLAHLVDLKLSPEDGGPYFVQFTPVPEVCQQCGQTKLAAEHTPRTHLFVSDPSQPIGDVRQLPIQPGQIRGVYDAIFRHLGGWSELDDFRGKVRGEGREALARDLLKLDLGQLSKLWDALLYGKVEALAELLQVSPESLWGAQVGPREKQQ